MGVTAALTGLSAIVGAVGSFAQAGAAADSANQQAAMAAYQAQIAEMNKRVAEENERRVQERAQVEQQDQDFEARAFIGAQEAAQSASGLALGGRSQIMTRRSAHELARRDALNIRQAGEIDAYNFRVDAANAGAQAQLHRMQADSYRQQASQSQLAGWIGATGSLLSGAGRIARQRDRAASIGSLLG